jgi:hypothetical protein
MTRDDIDKVRTHFTEELARAEKEMVYYRELHDAHPPDFTIALERCIEDTARIRLVLEALDALVWMLAGAEAAKNIAERVAAREATLTRVRDAVDLLDTEAQRNVEMAVRIDSAAMAHDAGAVARCVKRLREALAAAPAKEPA